MNKFGKYLIFSFLALVFSIIIFYLVYPKVITNRYFTERHLKIVLGKQYFIDNFRYVSSVRKTVESPYIGGPYMQHTYEFMPFSNDEQKYEFNVKSEFVLLNSVNYFTNFIPHCATNGSTPSRCDFPISYLEAKQLVDDKFKSDLHLSWDENTQRYSWVGRVLVGGSVDCVPEYLVVKVDVNTGEMSPIEKIGSNYCI